MAQIAMKSLRGADGILLGFTSKLDERTCGLSLVLRCMASFPVDRLLINGKGGSKRGGHSRLVLFKVPGARTIARCRTLQGTVFMIVLSWR